MAAVTICSGLFCIPLPFGHITLEDSGQNCEAPKTWLPCLIRMPTRESIDFYHYDPWVIHKGRILESFSNTLRKKKETRQTAQKLKTEAHFRVLICFEKKEQCKCFSFFAQNIVLVLFHQHFSNPLTQGCFIPSCLCQTPAYILLSPFSRTKIQKC